MEEKINEILNDLYKLDPSFRQHESKLRDLIVKLLQAKPDTKFDYHFAQSLRTQLLRQAPKPAFAKEVVAIKHRFSQRLSFIGATVAVVLVLFATTLYVNDRNGNQISFFTPGVKITSAGERAFGELTEVSTENRSVGLGSGGSATPLPAITESKDAGFTSTEISSPLVVSPEGKPIPPPPDYVVYRYVYKGEELKLEEAKREVLKRQGADADYLDGLLDNLGMGLANLRSFGNLKVQSVSFNEQGNQGYSVYVDSQRGSISISRYWDPVAMGVGFSDQLCEEKGSSCLPQPVYRPITIDEMPDDEILKTLAKDFVNEHNIPVDVYGEPEVLNQWRDYYERETDKSRIYIPETASVVFPLMIKNNFTYDESGYKIGMMVNISVRNKQVLGIYELNTQNYQSSMYDAETDVARILKVAEAGGVYGYYYAPGARIVDVELGVPTTELVRVWNYKFNDSQELMVPALVFPVIDPPADGPYYKKSVIVPLIKEILDKQQYPPYPVPLMESESPVQ